ncbi:MAG TPA: hypothetical protein VIO11_00070, partial [Candidatus Methanoperedens sp.]
IGSRIISCIDVRNSGDADLVDAELTIFFDGLKTVNEYDLGKGILSESTSEVGDIVWLNMSRYTLTPYNPGIARDGFFIKLSNFSNRTASVTASYNLSARNGTITENNPVIFNFTGENRFIGIRLLGINLSDDRAVLMLQFPEKNSLIQRYPVIWKDSSRSTKLGFLVFPSSGDSFTIRAAVTGKDNEGNIYKASNSKTVPVLKTLALHKVSSNSILGERLYPESYYKVGDVVTIKNITYVDIRVDNLQNFPVRGVKLEDSIPISFDLIGNAGANSISWTFDINASDHREFSYAITPKRQGVYDLPQALLTWREYGQEMHAYSSSSTTVSGPYIEVERSFNRSNLNIGDILRVTLSLRNSGDMPTNVSVNEIIPQNVTYLDGNLSYSGFLNPGESVNIAYNVRVNKVGMIEFNEPEMRSRNQGFEWFRKVQVKKFMVSYPGQAEQTKPGITATANPEASGKGIFQTINDRLPWLEGFVAIAALFTAILLLFVLDKMNRTL